MCLQGSPFSLSSPVLLGHTSHWAKVLLIYSKDMVWTDGLDSWAFLLALAKMGIYRGVARKGAGWGPEASPFLASWGLTIHPITCRCADLSALSEGTLGHLDRVLRVLRARVILPIIMPTSSTPETKLGLGTLSCLGPLPHSWPRRSEITMATGTAPLQARGLLWLLLVPGRVRTKSILCTEMEE